MKQAFIVIAGILLTICCNSAAAVDAEKDPFRICAARVVNGEFGKVAAWKLHHYQKALQSGVRCSGFAYLTSYGPYQSNKAIYGGDYAADSLPNGKGRKLDDTMCAADQGLPFGSIVWADGSLRVVRDRGGAVTVRNARWRNKLNNRNLDFFCFHRTLHSKTSTPYAIVRFGE